MERVFTKAVGKNFGIGEVRDYPGPTWEQIARSAGKPLDSFSKPVKEAAKEFTNKK